MTQIREYLQRHMLWVGFLAVIFPLVAILALQYESLVKLEKTSPIVQKVALKNYLWGVAEEVEEYYRTNAERALNLSSYTLAPERIEMVAYHFKNKTVRGSGQLFVVPTVKKSEPKVLFYNPASHTMEEREECPQMRAVLTACTPWRIVGVEVTPGESGSLVVNERDPENRIILNPIVDGSSRVIGIAGMIVDMVFLRDTLLPGIIKDTLPKRFPGGDHENLIVTVHDGHGRCVYATQPVRGQQDLATLPLPFIFKDWRLGIRSRDETPEQWARRYFLINLSLSILMMGVLVGGIVMALRTASREMKLSQMKTDFVSNVSHELRTPLASIRVFGEFLKMGRFKEPEKIREYGQYIETESRRLTQLINNILDFSKIESGQKTYRFEPADLTEVVGETLTTVDVQLTQKGFSIRCVSPTEALPAVVIDHQAIAQAVLNLLDNAVKYSGESKDIEVRLSAGNDEVRIAITDHGVGIPPDQRQKIFERFHRVGQGLIHDVKGSGLGLAIVKHIMDAHHGRVTVESDVGKGSTFTLHLPVHKTG